jgi:hypothetical protein
LDPFAVGTTVIGTGTNTLGQKAVVYASEIFKEATPPDMVPTAKDANDANGSDNFQAVCYEIPGIGSGAFSVNFNLTGGTFVITANVADQGYWAFAIHDKKGTLLNSDDAGCDVKATAAASKMTLDLPDRGASCTLADGAEICLVYKLASTTTSTTLATPGNNVTMAVTVLKTGAVVGTGGPLVVAESKQGAQFSLTPELGGDGEVFITAASGNRDFTSSGTASPTAFRSTSEVQIGYINYISGGVKDRDGTSNFLLGATDDSAVLEIDNGQFSASPGGASAGRVYLENISNAFATVTNSTDSWKATWNLNSTQLTAITADADGKIPIVVKVDGQTDIKDTLGGNNPAGKLEVKRGTKLLTDPAIESDLRRIPYDGKVCRAFNIPAPPEAGAQDILTLRIINDSEEPGEILGTLYNEEGVIKGDKLNLLVEPTAGADGYVHTHYVSGTPTKRTDLGLADPSQLQPKETVILTSRNIKELFGITDAVIDSEWKGKRWVLEIRSTIPRIEVFNLLRNVERVTEQPLSNVSTSAKNAECSPIP